MAFTERAGDGLRILLRSILPSPISVTLSILFAVFVIGSHVILLGLSGKAFPLTIDDILLQSYANYIIGPMSMALNSSMLSLLSLAAFWGLVGFIAYEGLSHLISAIQDWRTVKGDVTMPTEGVVRRHPLAESFLLHAFWRILIVVLTLLYTATLLPVIHYCLMNDERLLAATASGPALRIIGINVLLWAFIVHVYVILLRWYMFRTRITGEIIY